MNNVIVERTAELIQTDLDGEIVALDVDGGNCFGFNATAARVWQMLDRPRSIDAITDELMTEFEVDPAECRAAVVALVDDLAARKLVRTRPAA